MFFAMRRRFKRRSSRSRVGSRGRTRTRSNRKSLLICLILWLFLGFLGAHRFYVGKKMTGFFMILSLLTFVGFILWWLKDGIKIVTGEFRDKRGRRITWGFKVIFDR